MTQAARTAVEAIMTEALPVVYLARHGETAWSLSGRHTGLTDLPLTPHGENSARRLGDYLGGLAFVKVFTSPLQRARRTCELAGFGTAAEVDRDLVEWNYGEYEGLTSDAIHAERADWDLFHDGCPGGESPADVGLRADRAICHARAVHGNVLLFSSGHFLRVLAARWLGLAPAYGRYFLLGTASLCALGYEHDVRQPVIRLWNETPSADASCETPARLPAADRSAASPCGEYDSRVAPIHRMNRGDDPPTGRSSIAGKDR